MEVKRLRDKAVDREESASVMEAKAVRGPHGLGVGKGGKHL
jgi:hypothetical protein